jgi:NitT/TauT family transport system ATP-binding protein
MSGKPRLEFENVSVFYDTPGGRLQVADNVSYTVHDGEFLSLIGPSGCGKTTMLNMAAGFAKPTSGSVRLDGEPITGPGPDRGVMFQDYGVFPWLTVRQNIEFGLTLAANRASAATRETVSRRYMELMGLSAFADAWPRTLSGGMRQRLALARAYAVRPQFLLMDEPFGALDAQTRSAMQDLLIEAQEAEKKTVMLITHSVEEAVYLSSRIIVLTARPTRVREIIEVPFAFPRTAVLHERREFSELRAHVRDLVMQEYAQQTNLPT